MSQAPEGVSPSSALVFLSYSSRDEADVERVATSLTDVHELRVWLAPREIQPGENYAARILDGLAASTALVVLLTPASLQSAHVQREVSLALERGLKLIPIVKGNLLLSSLPHEWKYWLSTVQVHNWTSAEQTAEVVKRLVAPTAARPAARAIRAPARSKSHMTKSSARQIRSVVIRVARVDGNLDLALHNCRRLDCGENEVKTLVNQLRDNGLIDFTDPLTGATIIELKR